MLSSGCQHVLTGLAAVSAGATLHAGVSCAHERSPWCLCKRRRRAVAAACTHLDGGDCHSKLDVRLEPRLPGVALNVPLAFLASGIPAGRARAADGRQRRGHLVVRLGRVLQC